ncbi:hypothetical protein QL093DRAFT_2080319 [Fusarium oxysporum]|nr:hypothetical protein QL093DRAFT_2080319 [Fusarium oxysporum]
MPMMMEVSIFSLDQVCSSSAGYDSRSLIAKAPCPVFGMACYLGKAIILRTLIVDDKTKALPAQSGSPDKPYPKTVFNIQDYETNIFRSQYPNNAKKLLETAEKFANIKAFLIARLKRQSWWLWL